LRRDWDISPEAARLSGGVAHLPQQGDLRNAVPVICPAREWIMAAGLMSCGSSLADQVRVLPPSRLLTDQHVQ